MRRTRIDRKLHPSKEARNPILPVDPRDLDVLRVKRITRAATR